MRKYINIKTYDRWFDGIIWDGNDTVTWCVNDNQEVRYYDKHVVIQWLRRQIKQGNLKEVIEDIKPIRIIDKFEMS
jgi:hypothetical protein